MTVTLFDTEYDVIHDGVPIGEVPKLNSSTYSVRGTTALLDAVGRTIATIGQRLKNMKEDDRPSKIIVVIITDGQENSSKEFQKHRVAEMIRHQQEVYKWEFLFQGANIDAFAEGAALNIPQRNCMYYDHNSKGVHHVYAVTNDAVRALRGGPVIT